VVEKWCGVNANICREPFGKKLLGNIVLVDTLAWSFGPARETTNTDFNLFIAQVYDFYFSSSLTHPFYQVP
jgi:hypothetical protein